MAPCEMMASCLRRSWLWKFSSGNGLLEGCARGKLRKLCRDLTTQDGNGYSSGCSAQLRYGIGDHGTSFVYIGFGGGAAEGETE